MDLHHSLARLVGHHRLWPRTVRLRLTLLYGGLFLVSGAGLLAITNVLVRHNTSAADLKGLGTASIAVTKAPTTGTRPSLGLVWSLLRPTGRSHPLAAPRRLPTPPCCTSSRFNRALRCP